MDDLVRIGAAAQALGVSVDTLRRWDRAGKLQAMPEWLAQTK